MNPQHRTVLSFLRDHGATDVRIEMGGKHPRACFAWNGKEQFYVLPGTPSDTMRGVQNSLSDLRNMLGLVKHEKTVGERRVPKNKSAPRAKRLPDEISTPERIGTLLLAHPCNAHRLPALQDAAWLRLWQSLMLKHGARSMLKSFGRYAP